MKSKLPLIVALAIGIIALLGIQSYVKKAEERTQAQFKGRPVVSAREDIKAGTELNIQMLVPKEVPDQFIPPQAIEGSQNLKQIIGLKTRVPLRAGQILLASDVVTEVGGGLSSLIRPGEEAFTVTISKGIKTGLIQPNDHIDILGSFAAPKAGSTAPSPVEMTASSWRAGSDMVNVVLLQNVIVLAVGDEYGGAGRTSVANGDGTELTLSLSLQEAQLLMFASEHGELGAVLRREGNVEVAPRAELPRVTFEAIDQILGDLDGKRNFRNVEVQQGTKTSVQPVSK